MTKKEEESAGWGCLALMGIAGVIWMLNYITQHPVWLLLPIAVAGLYLYRWYEKDQNAKRQMSIDLQVQLQQGIARKKHNELFQTCACCGQFKPLHQRTRYTRQFFKQALLRLL